MLLKSALLSILLAAVSTMSNAEPYPTRVLAGVTVVDTPLVRAAIDYARSRADEFVFNHVMRSWLFSVIITTKAKVPVDAEIQALASILHDLGWDKTGELVSKDKRFEVDGAIAARNWVESEAKKRKLTGWDGQRTQLIWDSIALHTTPSISAYKEPVVGMVGAGITSDFGGPCTNPIAQTLTWDEFKTVGESYPRLNVGKGIRKIICGLAETKPDTTFDKYAVRDWLKSRTDDLQLADAIWN